MNVEGTRDVMNDAISGLNVHGTRDVRMEV